MSSGRLPSALEAPPPATSVLGLLNQQRDHRRRVFTYGLIGFLLLFVIMFLKALYSQQKVIRVFNQDIDTTNVQIMESAVLLAPLLSPIRIALACEYPFMVTFLGYTNPLTPVTIAQFVELEPSTTRAVAALILLESGLTVDTENTRPPTLVQEVINQLYPKDTFVPPKPVYVPPTPAKQGTSLLMAILPQVAPVVMLVAMLAG